jgi:hypothetical protein
LRPEPCKNSDERAGAASGAVRAYNGDSEEFVNEEQAQHGRCDFEFRLDIGIAAGDR